MPSPSPLAGSRIAAVLLAVVACQWDVPAHSQIEKQAPKDAGAGVFDDEKPKGAKPPSTEKPPASRETIGFTQQNAAAQMTELEERMFRLSEALRGLEPENASRLRLALKFSREELILEQMREANKMLKEAQLNKAETEVRELLAKLEHLRDVLLAEDLDFQLKLARLRQMRETLGQLDRIVKDEQRELGWSRFAIDQKKARERLSGRRPDLESLARDQGAVIADTKGLPQGDPESRKAPRAAIRAREDAIRKSAAALAADTLFADFQPSQIRKADAFLGDASTRLDADGVAEAVAAEEKAAEVFRDELKRLDDRIAEAGSSIAEAEFRRHEAGQVRNRGAADALAAASTRLGDAGVALQKDLIRAGDPMKGAEKNLAKSAADPAAADQNAALEILARSQADLAQATEKLLVQLRVELQAKIVAELTEMHEEQASIRETTEAQAPRLAQKSRSASIAVGGLSQKEGALGGRAEHFLALVEETEYGIALPTTLRVLGREMRSVEARLKAVDASASTIALEKRIEDDLLGLLQAVRRLPPTTPPSPGDPLPADLRERERELNRLVAELKMVRMLQSRLNEETTGVDKTRPAAPTLPPALRREVETLESTQDEIRESLAKIAERLPQP